MTTPHATLHFDQNHELLVTLPGDSKDSSRDYRIGHVTDARFHLVPRWITSSKTVHLAHEDFYLDNGEVESLKQRTIATLPFSDITKSVLTELFNQLFNEAEVTGEEFISIIEMGKELDELYKCADQLRKQHTPFQADDLKFIFGARQEMERHMKGVEKFASQTTNSFTVFQDTLHRLVRKAKIEIKQSVRHLSADAAAQKGKALQAGLKAIMELETGTLRHDPTVSTDTVSVYPEAGAVIKKGSARSREEEQQIDALMSLSRESATVPLFTFSELSSHRFGISNEKEIDLSQSSDTECRCKTLR